MSENYKTPEQRKRRYLDDAISLIIVHANSKHDPSMISKKPIQELIDKDFAHYIYEFVAHHDSFVKHDGILIDNNRCPGDYHIDNLAGNDYIIVGGGLGNCHFGVYLALLASRFTRKTTIHLPGDAIYSTFEDSDADDGKFLRSELSAIPDYEFRRYETLIKTVSDHCGYEINHDKKPVESSGEKLLQLMLWSSKKKMLHYLVADEQRL